jgi:hypothetical protein
MAATSAAAVNALAAFTDAGTVARKFSTVLAPGDFGLPAWCLRGSMRLAPNHTRVYAAEVTGRLCQRPHSDDRSERVHFRALPPECSDALATTLVHLVGTRSVPHGRAAAHARVVIEALTTVVWPNCRTAVSL